MKRLALISCCLLLATASAAIAKTVIYSGAHHGSFPSKPSKLKYSAGETGTTQSVKAKDLDWKNWGDSKATSTATVTLCSDSAGCFTTSDASVKAKKREVIDTIGYYRKLVVYFGQNAIKFSLPTP
ncbi:MAG: hypothetical protein QOI10_2265 [Solirubrobacterales bacterium]|jgi:hypothetical protein|nr:hypothetical protein [Solirubrobacterales bacterium]